MRIIGLIDPSINSYNLGDQIVMNHIMEILSNKFPNDFFIRVPAYGVNDNRVWEIASKADFFIFCGTGPICSDITFRWPVKKWQYDRKVIFLGIGANSYNVNLTYEAKTIYESNLSKTYAHSARDNYSRKIIDDMGYLAYNTGCPTLWNLKGISHSYKPTNVMLTLNSSRQDYERDLNLIEFLHKHYGKMYFYAQTPNDMIYAKELGVFPEVLVPSNLHAINNILKNEELDYVGHRLHGGINALHHKQRTFIISVDNRAAEMKKDFNLPIFDISNGIDELKNSIEESYWLNFNLPTHEINKWLEQFDV